MSLLGSREAGLVQVIEVWMCEGRLGREALAWVVHKHLLHREGESERRRKRRARANLEQVTASLTHAAANSSEGLASPLWEVGLPIRELLHPGPTGIGRSTQDPAQHTHTHTHTHTRTLTQEECYDAH